MTAMVAAEAVDSGHQRTTTEQWQRIATEAAGERLGSLRLRLRQREKALAAEVAGEKTHARVGSGSRGRA